MKRVCFVSFILCLIILADSCKKNKLDLPPSDDFHPASITSYISSGSGRPDSISYLLTYDNAGNKIQRIDVNPFMMFPPTSSDYIAKSYGFDFINHLSNGYDYTVNYYTDANKRVTHLVDSLFNETYDFYYNSSGYLDNVVKSDSRVLNDTVLYAYFYYDLSNNIIKIEEHSYSIWDSRWIISADISVEKTALTFPGKAYSTFSIGRPFTFSNRIRPYQRLLFIYQTEDIPFNFGNPQQFLPSKFTNTSVIYSSSVVDSFTYTSDNLNRISNCTDFSTSSLSHSSSLTILKDTIIY